MVPLTDIGGRAGERKGVPCVWSRLEDSGSLGDKGLTFEW